MFTQHAVDSDFEHIGHDLFEALPGDVECHSFTSYIADTDVLGISRYLSCIFDALEAFLSFERGTKDFLDVRSAQFILLCFAHFFLLWLYGFDV